MSSRLSHSVHQAGHALVLLAALVSQGCGTIVHGTRQDLSITTNPPGATASVDDETCDTPCTLRVHRKTTSLTLTKGTYREEIDLERRFNVWSSLVGNIIFYVVPGILFDAATGGAYEISPVNVTIDESGAAAKGSEPAPEETGDMDIEPISDYAPIEGPKRALSLGVTAYLEPDGTAAAAHLGYEVMLNRLVSFFAKVAHINERSDFGDYRDAKQGTGAEVGMLFYPGRKALEGGYLGGGLGFWSVTGHWEDDLGTPFVTSGRGECSSVELAFHTGYKKYFSERNVFIDPSLGVGIRINSAHPDPFELGRGYLSAGLGVGVRW